MTQSSREIGGAPSHLTEAQAKLWDEFVRTQPKGIEMADRGVVEYLCKLAERDRNNELNPGQVKELKRTLSAKFGLTWTYKKFWPRKGFKAIQ
jgi:hypothetical protein